PAGALSGMLALATRLALLLATLLCLASSPARADIPPSDILEELRDRLLEPPECSPDCASIPRLALEVAPSSLRARLDVHAAADTAVPLPGSSVEWIPRQVLLDGAPAPGLVRTGGRAALAAGFSWRTPGADGRGAARTGGIQIPLPLRPHRVTARAEGWRVEGLREDGLVDDSLQLMRLRGGDRAAERVLEPGPLPSFVRVERELRLGLKWAVATRVVRLTPPGAAVLLEVPLIAGESVTSPEVRVSDGRAQLNLGPQFTEAAWQSSLSQRPL